MALDDVVMLKSVSSRSKRKHSGGKMNTVRKLMRGKEGTTEGLVGKVTTAEVRKIRSATYYKSSKKCT